MPEARVAERPTCGRCKEHLDVESGPQDVSADELARVVEAAPVPVLVDFWAPWCGPCRMAAPIIDGIAREAAGRMLVVKLNSDDYPDASQSARVQGIPTFVIFRDGREIARQTGLPPGSALKRWVERHAA